MKRPIEIAEGTPEVPPPGPAREALRIKLVLDEVRKIQGEWTTFVDDEDAICLAQAQVRGKLGEKGARSDEESDRLTAIVDRYAYVQPSQSPADAEARASAVEALQARDADLTMQKSVVDAIQAKHDAAARVVEDAKERARVARLAFEGRTISDSEKRRRELRLDAEVAEDSVALSMEALDVVARRLRDARATQAAAAQQVETARAAVAKIDIAAEARIARVVETFEQLRRATHEARMHQWQAKMARHAPTGLDVKQILVDAELIRLPDPVLPERTTSVMLSFERVGSQPMPASLTDEQIQFLSSLGVQILTMDYLGRGTAADGRTASNFATPAAPIVLESLPPTPVPSESSTPHEVSHRVVHPSF